MKRLSRVAISVGELSGDRHGARVVEELRKIYPDIAVRGMGGRNLRAAGVDTIVDSEQVGSVMGFQEILGKLRGLRRALGSMRSMLTDWRPDILIVVDFPDFNLRLARYARSLGVPVLYFIPPKVWAWRSGRVKTLSDNVDHLAVIFPFEKDFYEKSYLKRVSYVGHPFADDPRFSGGEALARVDVCRELGLDPERPVVSFFPGSRLFELERHLPLMMKALTILRAEHPELQAVVSVAPTFSEDSIRSIIHIPEGVVCVSRDASEVLAASDASVMKSGTCNLEAAFMHVPFLCVYRASAFSAWMFRKFVKLPEVSPVNLIRAGSVTELLQENASPEAVATHLSALLFDARRREHVMHSLSEVVGSLQSSDRDRVFHGTGSSPERVARLAAKIAGNPHPFRSIRSRVLSYLRPYTLHFLVALLCMIGFGASDGAVPFIVKHILDKVFASQDMALLYGISAILVVFALFRAAVDFGQQFFMSRIGHLIVRDLRNELNRHLLKLSPGFFVQQSSANLVTRITSDVVLVRNLLTDCVASILRDSVRLVTLVGAALYLDWKLALIAIVVFPIGVLPVYRIGRRMRRLSRKGQEAIGGLSATLQETILGNRVVKIFGREDFEIARFEQANERLNRTFVKSEIARAMTGPINETLASIAVAAVILYGGYSVIHGIRSQGDFIAFLIAVFLMYDPFKKLARVNATVQQGLAGAERIFELLDTVPDIRDPEHPKPLATSNALEIRHVTFSYPGSDQAALQDVTLSIGEGKKIALVGFSGAGKSTLIDLLPRFIDPEAGEVLIGGINVRDVKLEDLRDRFALVGQHTFLFNDSVFNNIAYGHPEATEEDVFRAAKAAFAYDFVMTLPDGFHTMVGEGGLTLSGGERQRIAIARAVLKNAPILILDEATASLDNRSEREVQNALDALEKGRTTIVIAHRLSTIRSADLIVVMQDGMIVEQGPHGELLSRGGEYARLYSLQFREGNESDPSRTLLQ